MSFIQQFILLKKVQNFISRYQSLLHTICKKHGTANDICQLTTSFLHQECHLVT
ncbi:hypothetical protein BHE74_00013705 [Ensete ventricosum]|nr:hypothetical protein BHE74_00013705 [Ensete ventricosum]